MITKNMDAPTEPQRRRTSIYFENNSDVISEKASQTIRNFLSHPGLITVEGFTSKTGKETRNKELRKARAKAVGELIQVMEPERTIQVIHSETPSWIFDTPSLNRRVQLIIQGD